MYGADTSSLEELSNTVTQLEDLKIEIKEQPTEIDEINTSIENMKQQINQVDKNILTDETNIETEIVISEDSNFNTIFSNVDVIIQKVNEQVAVETSRKAEEERIAQEKTEKQAYVGTYKNNQNQTMTITMDDSGELYLNFWTYSEKINIEEKNKDGAIIIEQYPEYGMAGKYIYPIGTNISIVTLGTFDNNGNWVNSKVDNTKIRILHLGSAEPDISGCFYKVD